MTGHVNANGYARLYRNIMFHVKQLRKCKEVSVYHDSMTMFNVFFMEVKTSLMKEEKVILCDSCFYVLELV